MFDGFVPLPISHHFFLAVLKLWCQKCLYGMMGMLGVSPIMSFYGNHWRLLGMLAMSSDRITLPSGFWTWLNTCFWFTVTRSTFQKNSGFYHTLSMSIVFKFIPFKKKVNHVQWNMAIQLGTTHPLRNLHPCYQTGESWVKAFTSILVMCTCGPWQLVSECGESRKKKYIYIYVYIYIYICWMSKGNTWRQQVCPFKQLMCPLKKRKKQLGLPFGIWYPLVNDHIAGWKIPIFPGKYHQNGGFSSQLCLLVSWSWSLNPRLLEIAESPQNYGRKPVMSRES